MPLRVTFFTLAQAKEELDQFGSNEVYYYRLELGKVTDFILRIAEPIFRIVVAPTEAQFLAVFPGIINTAGDAPPGQVLHASKKVASIS